jgi:hypothetical protein
MLVVRCVRKRLEDVIEKERKREREREKCYIYLKWCYIFEVVQCDASLYAAYIYRHFKYI